MFFCECLNIIGEINDVHSKLASSSVKVSPIQTLIMDSSYYDLLDFFKLAVGPIKDTKISIQHSAFINKVRMDNRWIVSKCLNCDCNVFAVADDTNEVLINEKMLRDKNMLLEMIKNPNYSNSFKIILKPMELLPNKTKSAINNDVRVKQLFSTLQDYISKDEKDTEAEIKRLRLALAQRRQQAEKEFQLIVTLIGSIESNYDSSNNSGNARSTHESTNMSTENIQMFSSITPPVTPESAQMTFDQAPSPFNKLMTNNNSNNHHQYNNNHREGISKHNNAIIPKQRTRAIEFEDDIFELDGMQKDDDDSSDINGRYNKSSDTENSDVEEMMHEKRPYMRVRSGSLAIARSAPISMPQFLQHTNPHLEEKPINEQDIAGSIKLLAKSIHADSIFGELPNRSYYNAEF
ncbi:hypothetical protein PVAND_002769 [Polypedilum vanderplanki]|uniref:Uncharacterized protein n=1 Tax=Polypedilum vanderplanki TaxID=319348 RepID=A0A9J6BS03_POLVA|nr:hypothetical protein PVAND_002769 [Polypedilum vanderplanki]